MTALPGKPTEEGWPRIGVLGAGAVGCYFGGKLAAAGAPVTLIARAHHVEAIHRHGLAFDSLGAERTIPLSASTEVSDLRDADVVLLSVKAIDTDEAAKSLAPHLATGAIVVSLQNGVDNVDRIRSSAGIEALPAVVYVAAEMTAPGRVKHSGRGDLVIGDPSGSRQRELLRLAMLLARAGVPHVVSPNIEGELWTKLILNCAYNAISALGRARYGRIVRNPGARALMRMVVEETVTVGRSSGVRLPDVDWFETAWKLGEAMELATSSMAQDLGRGKRTEIDALNGYVVRRGTELGVPTPSNQTLLALVKLLEEGL